MIRLRALRDLRVDTVGATVIEFAILAPAVIAMIMGVFTIGMQMQSYNALRSIAGDVNRYTVVEYQKANELTAEQIQQVAASIAVHAPYDLSGDELDVAVTEGGTIVEGAKRFSVVLTYTPFNALKFYHINAMTLTYRQNIYVAS